MVEPQTSSISLKMIWCGIEVCLSGYCKQRHLGYLVVEKHDDELERLNEIERMNKTIPLEPVVA